MEIFALLPHKSAGNVNLLMDRSGLSMWHTRIVDPATKAAASLLGRNSHNNEGYAATLCKGRAYPHASQEVIEKSLLKAEPEAFFAFGQKALALEKFFIGNEYDEDTEQAIIAGEYQFA